MVSVRIAVTNSGESIKPGTGLNLNMSHCLIEKLLTIYRMKERENRQSFGEGMRLWYPLVELVEIRCNVKKVKRWEVEFLMKKEENFSGALLHMMRIFILTLEALH
jgi:hypothetical protein